ncbi:MAG: hypothetical protein COV43_01970 [Deltaproteobacteria bacterium CG11_big_fil_rev_8_21_14_0_20_42_23]|nr:MAG: hypothetical protein COV43_01970 [Deltaproteobacteria bacterium CG11_big_fil_rev_8_21_14_0_20_42_23]PJC63880.1 MAG: hypothetical protein CO021_07150 [Deltaproteobacteria bacterium CG_4_9_14_0_2_um_filter_42_21]
MLKQCALLLFFISLFICSCGNDFSPVSQDQSQNPVAISDDTQTESETNEPQANETEPDPQVTPTPPPSQNSLLVDAPTGIWVWKNVEEIIQAEKRETFFDELSFYSKAENISLFLNINTEKISDDSFYQENIASFLEAAHARGIQVHALGSATEWIDNPENAIAKFVVPTLEFDFDGLHFDVEAHLHPSWNEEDNEELLQNFLALAQQVKEASAEQAVYWDIPSWYFKDSAKVMVEGISIGKLIVEENIFPVLMSYRDTAQEIENFSQAALEYLVEQNRDWFFAVETSSAESEDITYAGECLEHLVDDINTLFDHYQKGTAIHNWTTLQELELCEAEE